MTSGMAQSVEKGDQLKTILLNIVPIGRMGNADEIARAVTFFTGIELLIDGGLAQI
jgi:NAD(P)-dependent dehydrogenase (short-subunit alcohol dehydrogenase family)